MGPLVGYARFGRRVFALSDVAFINVGGNTPEVRF